jgi:poly(A) polymerase
MTIVYLDITKSQWLREPSTQTIMAALNTRSSEARFVGGCVRNSLMDEPVTDIDIAINVPPSDVITLLQNANIQFVPTGVQYGTVTAVIEGKAFEITSLRRDIRTDGRHAVVDYTDNWEEDAQRRDFTINALYADMLGRVFDPLGEGLLDIDRRIIRFIGSPSDRIREDYLRILRFYRFSAWYGQDGEMDETARAACCEKIKSENFQKVSTERITDEIRKLFKAKNPWFVLKIMIEDRSLTHLFKDVFFDESFFQVSDWLHRLALVVSDVETLRLSKKELNKFNSFKKAIRETNITPEVLSWKYGYQVAKDVLNVQGKVFNPETLQEYESYKCPVTAQDLINYGYKPDKELGDALKKSEKIWLETNLTANKSEILLKIKKE